MDTQKCLIRVMDDSGEYIPREVDGYPFVFEGVELFAFDELAAGLKNGFGWRVSEAWTGALIPRTPGSPSREEAEERAKSFVQRYGAAQMVLDRAGWGDVRQEARRAKPKGERHE